jgi:O-antigen/teichoic acid export membrane protein
LSHLAGRIGTHSLIYALSAITSVLAGLLNVAVLTRYLGPGEFGRLAVLMVSASLLTLVFNAGSLQGTFSLVYGASDGDGDGEGDGDGDAEELGDRVGALDRRRALTTGLALTAAAGTVGTAVLVVVARPAADILLGDRSWGRLLVWTGAGAALASVWRLAANAIRLERRPWAYLAAAAAQHLLGLAFAIPFLAAGRGVEGAVVGLALGNAAALGFALWLIRHSVRAAVSLSDAASIMRRGRALVPVVVGFNTIQLADVLLLSRFAPSADVGLYRAASRIGATVSYWTTSFHMAWGAMRRHPLHDAADAERGRAAVASVLATYFCLITLGSVLAVGLFSEELVRIAAPSYRGAAGLIPLTAAAFAFHGLFVLVYRTEDFPEKRRWFIALALVNAVAFALSGLIWIPALGAYGASAAVITGWSVGILALLIRGRLGPNPIPYEAKKLAAGLLVATACFVSAKALTVDAAAQQAALDALFLLAYPAALLALRVVPAAHVRALRELVRGTSPRNRGSALQGQEHALVDALLGHGQPAEAVAREHGLSVPQTYERLVAAVRRRAGLGASRDDDALLGELVLFEGPFAERDRLMRRTFAKGLDPIDADRVIRATAALRRETRATWRATAAAGAAEPPQVPHRRLPDDGAQPTS